MSVIGRHDFWMREAAIASADGHPYAALYAFANALLPERVLADHRSAKLEHPDEWLRIKAYADALGIGHVLRDD